MLTTTNANAFQMIRGRMVNALQRDPAKHPALTLQAPEDAATELATAIEAHNSEAQALEARLADWSRGVYALVGLLEHPEGADLQAIQAKAGDLRRARFENIRDEQAMMQRAADLLKDIEQAHRSNTDRLHAEAEKIFDRTSKKLAKDGFGPEAMPAAAHPGQATVAQRQFDFQVRRSAPVQQADAATAAERNRAEQARTRAAQLRNAAQAIEADLADAWRNLVGPLV